MSGPKEQALPRFRQLFDAVKDADALLDAEGLANRRAASIRQAALGALPQADPYRTLSENAAHYRDKARAALVAEGEMHAREERYCTLVDAANALRVQRAAITATAAAAVIELGQRAAWLDWLARNPEATDACA